jgi:hypothetical protein
VIVNGVPVVRGGELTGELPGRVIRRSEPVPGEMVKLGILPGTGIGDLSRKGA